MSESTDGLSPELHALRIDRSGQRRSSAGRTFLIAAVLAAGIVTIALQRPQLEAWLFKTPVELTEISLVSPVQAAIELSSSGYVVPHIRSAVGARIPGRVSKLFVRQGQHVEANQVLIELERSTQQATLQAAKQKALVARAQVASARALLEEVRLQARRQSLLVKQGAAPAAAAEDASTRVASIEAQVSVAQAEADAADAEVNVLKVNLDAMTITAPISGVVLNKPPEVGEMLGNDLGIGTTVGTIEIAEMSTLYIETDVPEGRLHLVKVGAPCEIVLDAYPERRFRGEAVEVTPHVSRSKATVGVKVRFTDDTTEVLPDMSARVSFLSKSLTPEQQNERPKLVVPANALSQRDGKHMLFVVEGDTVHAQSVALGEQVGDGFELERGPAAGTRVVKDPPATLHDQSRIKEQLGS
jgi:RND family efflux transporter MFP subunit